MVSTEAADAQGADILILKEVNDGGHGVLRFQSRNGHTLQDIALLVADGADHLGTAGFQTAVEFHNSLRSF